MTGVRFLLAVLLLPVAGLPITRLAAVARLNVAGRVAAAAGAAFVALGLEMLAFTWLGIRWSLVTLSLPLAAILLLHLFLPGRPRPSVDGFRPRALPGLAAAAAALLLIAYAAGTARMTSSDLLLHWGTKGERFALARGVDLAFLRGHELLAIDYPPLVPFLYAWSAVAAGRFAWGASLLFLPIFLFLTAAGFWACSRIALGDRRASELTAVLVALLGYCMAVSLTAGNADAPLLFFEASALSVVAFGSRSLHRDLVASIFLAGAVLTKVEGVVFAIVLVACVVVFDRNRRERGRSLIALSALPFFCWLTWFAYAVQHGLLRRSLGTLSLEYLDVVLAEMWKSAAYESFYTPWLVVAALWIAAPRRSAGRVPALVGAGCLVANVVYYLSSTIDPSVWIGWTASRTLLTPLLCFFVAASCAATERIRDAIAPSSAGSPS